MEDLGTQLATLDDDMLGMLHQFMRACTGNARSEWERICAANGIHFDETGSAIGSEGQAVDVPTPDLVEALEREAVDFDRIKLGRSTMGVWKDKVKNLRSMEREADQFAVRMIARRALQHWYAVMQEGRRREARFERRIRVFQEWKDACVVSACLRRWVIAHRMKSMQTLRNRQVVKKAVAIWQEKARQVKRKEQQAEDARDYYAASSIFRLWRAKTEESKRRRKFKLFYLSSKYGKAWLQRFRAQKKAQTEAELTKRYHSFVRQKDEKIKRRTFKHWHTKAIQIREDDISAKEHHDSKADARAKALAHTTITKLYDTTVDNQENREIADAHYDKGLIDRYNLLGEDGKWRTLAREHRKHEAIAEDYRDIQVGSKAQSALRNMRNAVARNRQMTAMADEWNEKQDRRKALGHLRLWRKKAALKRGQRMAPAAPQTPAARKTALFH